MEDAHIVENKFDDEDTYLFAVFDGHGGTILTIESLNFRPGSGSLRLRAFLLNFKGGL